MPGDEKTPDLVSTRTSAGRLCRLLQRLETTCSEKDGKVKTTVAIAEALICEDNPAELMDAVARLNKLVAKVADDISSVDQTYSGQIVPSLNEFNHWLVVGCLSANTAGQLRDQIKNKNLIPLIGFAATILEHNGKLEIAGEYPISAVEELIERVNEIIKDVVSADLPDELRLALLDIFESALTGLRAAIIIGPSGLSDTTTMLCGMVFRHRLQLKSNENTPLVKKAWGLFIEIDRIVGFINKVKQLPGISEVGKLLLGSDDATHINP